AHTFQEVVQRLTGPLETNAAQEGAATKVVGRRQYSRPKLAIVKPTCPFKPGTLTGSTDQHSFSPIKSGNCGFLPSTMIPSKMFSKLSIFEEEKNKESAIPE
ncbi:vq motif-containing protein 31, partial [Quercus suber]